MKLTHRQTPAFFGIIVLAIALGMMIPWVTSAQNTYEKITADGVVEDRDMVQVRETFPAVSETKIHTPYSVATRLAVVRTGISRLQAEEAALLVLQPLVQAEADEVILAEPAE